MADTKISGLTALTGANTASGDLLTIVDVSDTTMAATGTNKKITLTELQSAPVSGGTANGVLYLNGSKVATSGSALTFDGTTLGMSNGGGVNIGGNVSLYGDANQTVIRGRTTNGVIFQDQAGTGEWMRLTSTGLGIGTSLPGSKLSIAASTTAANADIELANSAGIKNYVFTGGSTNATTRWQNNLVLYVGGSQNILFETSATERMRLDSSGNLGLGVTPSTWFSSRKVLSMNSGGVSYTGVTDGTAEVWANSYLNAAGNSIYATSSYAALYQVNKGGAGIHAWLTAPSGTAGNAITFTQAMTLDASGNLGVGTTSPSNYTNFKTFEVGAGGGTKGGLIRWSGASNTVVAYAWTDTTSTQFWLGTQTSHPLVFGTADTERARIDSSGNLLVGTTTQRGDSEKFSSYQTADGNAACFYGKNATQTKATVLLFSDRNTTNNTFYALSYYNVGAGASKFLVADSGNVTNTNGSYGTISDVKMKTGIVDAGSQWADIKAIRFRKFKMKDDPDQVIQLGVIAQELETVSPGLVEEHNDRDQEGNDLGTTTKSVKTSVLLMKAAVALQEAMTRIEQLESRVAALES